MTKRELLYADIAYMRDVEGRQWKDIAGIVGLARSTVHDYYHDPTGEKARARKAASNGSCVDCGAVTISDGGKAPLRCVPCGWVQSGATRKVWTREAIVAAIRDWVATYGEPPSAPDWNPTQARYLGDAQRAERFLSAGRRWPFHTTLVREFGSWNAAIHAAGFEGRPAHGGGGNESRRRRARSKVTAERTAA